MGWNGFERLAKMAALLPDRNFHSQSSLTAGLGGVSTSRTTHGVLECVFAKARSAMMRYGAILRKVTQASSLFRRRRHRLEARVTFHSRPPQCAADGLGEKPLQRHAEAAGEMHDVLIARPAAPPFDLRNRIPSDVPAEQLALRRQHGLREVALVAQPAHLLTDNVAR